MEPKCLRAEIFCSCNNNQKKIVLHILAVWLYFVSQDKKKRPINPTPPCMSDVLAELTFYLLFVLFKSLKVNMDMIFGIVNFCFYSDWKYTEIIIVYYILGLSQTGWLCNNVCFSLYLSLSYSLSLPHLRAQKRELHKHIWTYKTNKSVLWKYAAHAYMQIRTMYFMVCMCVSQN